MSRKSAAAASVVLLTGALSGCSNAADGDVRSTATAFYRAVAEHHAMSACAALAPKTRSELEKSAGKPCEDAILEEDIPSVVQPRTVQRFGTMAKVDFDGETAFLARFQDGWKVMAAVCSDQKDKPYDCQIQGG